MRKLRESIVIGKSYNYLTAISFSHSDKRHRKWYNVTCVCGVEKKVMGSAIISNNTKSCGCKSIESAKLRRISENHCEITAIILSYKRHAKSRGITFELTRELVSDIIIQKCYYCGCEPNNFMKTKNSIIGLKYNGIDRFNSN